MCNDIRKHAASLSEAPAELIRQILDKHHEAVLEMLKEEVRRAKSCRQALRKLLACDGDHMTACDRTMGATHPCTCGADAARALFREDGGKDGA